MNIQSIYAYNNKSTLKLIEHDYCRDRKKIDNLKGFKINIQRNSIN